MSYTIEIYRLDPVSGAFIPLDEFANYLSLDFFNRLNGMGGCSFSLDINIVKARATVLRRASSQVAIKKNDKIVWLGAISKVSRDYSDVGGTIQVQAESYLSHLGYRYTDSVVRYVETDAGAIANGLITDTQAKSNGELLITSGVNETTQDRDRTYYYKNIAEAIMQLSKVINGFDFDFSYTQDANNKLTGVLFNVYTSRGQLRNNLPPLRLGENVQRATYATQGDIINTITALGNGTGEGVLSSVQESTGSQQSFTRREYVAPQKDISVQSTLDQSAQAQLIQTAGENYHIELQLTPTSSPRFGDFVIGDTLVLDLSSDPSSFITMATNARCIELAVSIDSNGVETMYPKFETNI